MRISNKEKIVEFLIDSLKREIYSIYYVFNSLYLLEEDLPDLSDFLLQRLDNAVNRINKEVSLERGTTATCSFEMPNVLKEVYLITNSLKLLGKDVNRAKSFIKKFRRNEGFGTNSSNIKKTYYCVSVLGEVDKDVISFIKQHEYKTVDLQKRQMAIHHTLKKRFTLFNALKF